MQGLSWGVPVVTGDMSMGRGIVLAALCIPLALAAGPVQAVTACLRTAFLCAARRISNKFGSPCGHKKTAKTSRFLLAVKGGLCSLCCAFPWPLAAGLLQSPMRQLLRSQLLCILTLCEQVPNGHYTKTAASL